MSFEIRYREFFRVTLLHRYFLNQGETAYESLPVPTRNELLKAYDIRNFLSIEPTPETISILNGHKLAVNNHSSGFSVWGQVDAANPGKPFVEPDFDISLTFLIRIKDNRFYNFTELPVINSQSLYYFSNRKSETELPDFPLIGLAGGTPTEAVDYGVTQITASDLLKQIPVAKTGNLFGILSVYAEGENSTYDIFNDQNEIHDDAVHFEINFDNRQTFWRYIFRTAQDVEPTDDVEIENSNPTILVTKTLQPLTSRGFIKITKGDSELPNAGISAIVPDLTNNKIYSEIFM